MEAFDRVLAARSGERPTGDDFIRGIFTDFFELRGDRRFSDDRAIVAGIARLGRMPVTVLAIDKGHGTAERIARNFGSAQPEGYRKALRQFLLAEKFARPIVSFVDTAGAACGLGAEERGQGQAIAENLFTLVGVSVPVLSVITGEGGSGGALALALADRIWMLENAVYSVISPEGCASILWKDPSRTREAAAHLRLTAQDLLDLGVVDRVVPEEGGREALFARLRDGLHDEAGMLAAMPADELRKGRYRRLRELGGVL